MAFQSLAWRLLAGQAVAYPPLPCVQRGREPFESSYGVDMHHHEVRLLAEPVVPVRGLSTGALMQLLELPLPLAPSDSPEIHEGGLK